MILIPSRDSYYFTGGKEYPVIRRLGIENCLAEVQDDNGIVRHVSLNNLGQRSSHLLAPISASRPSGAATWGQIADQDSYSWQNAGHWVRKDEEV